MAPNRRFPASGILVDACGLLRLYKCEALDVFASIGPVHIADQVQAEFSRRGAAQKAALSRLKPTKHTVTPGSASWEDFCLLRGALHGTRNLGEQESIAVCMAEARRGVLLPFVSYDDGAARIAAARGGVVLDFLSTLAWAVELGGLTSDQADQLEERAQAVNGWQRPEGYLGHIEERRAVLVAQTGMAVQNWKPRRGR